MGGALPFEESEDFRPMGLDKSACANQSQKLLDDEHNWPIVMPARG
jgi:hypothetical protein